LRESHKRILETHQADVLTSNISNHQETAVKEPAPSESLGCTGYSIWFMWLLVNLAGMGIGWALGWRLSFVVPGIIATWVIGSVSGAILGLFQWLYLRIVIDLNALWILYSFLSWAIGFFLGAQVAGALGLTEFAFGLAIGSILGLSLGISQWSLLRSKFGGAGWWIIFNIVAWSASLVVYLPGANAMGLFYGGVSGAITGLALLGMRYKIFLSGQ
jgi:hypothetical protein